MTHLQDTNAKKVDSGTISSGIEVIRETLTWKQPQYII